MEDGKYVILCVDDDPEILLYLETVLETEGYIVAQAKSAEEGLRVYQKVDPDLIILDLMMEEVDAGTNFVKELKLLDNKAPIYLLSSAGDNLHMAVDTSSLGLAGVFQKPLNKERLLGIISAKLGI